MIGSIQISPDLETNMTLDKNAFVIVVDDDDTYLRMLTFMIRRAGVGRVEAFSNVEEAFARAIERRPDVIVSDWNMDPTDGLEFLKMTRANERLAHTPFIMATANVAEEYWRRAIEAGATDFLFKPLGMKEIYEAVRGALLLGETRERLDAPTRHSRARGGAKSP
jgi:DNA-binding response OmpR family regulator